MWCLLHPARICASTARCLARLWSYLEQWLAEPGFLLVFQAAQTQDRHVQPGRHYQALCTDHPSCVIANLATKHHLQARRNSFKYGWDQKFNSILIFFVEFWARRFFAVHRAKTNQNFSATFLLHSYQFTIQILINEGRPQKISKDLIHFISLSVGWV